MFSYTVVSGCGEGEVTLLISGNAVFTHTEEMNEALSDALDSCEHLTVDVGSANELDLTFRVLLCSLHRRSLLMNKRISVRFSHMPGGEERRGGFARVEGCLYKDATAFCSLWHHITGAE